MRLSNYLAVAACAATAAIATAQPTLTYETTLDVAAHADVSRFVGGVPRAGGGFYFVDNGSDGIYVVQNPLTANGGSSTDVPQIAVVGYTSGHSSIAITDDGTNLFGGGANGSATQYYQISGYPTAAQAATALTEPTGVWNGPDAIAANKLVAPNASTGALHFFSVSGTNVTDDGSVALTGAPANPRFIRAVVAGNRIFVNAAGQNLTGIVYVFNTNGTLAGTTFVGQYIAGVSSSYAGPTYTSASFYGGMDYDATNQLLAVACNRGASGQDGWAVYDVSGGTPTEIEFIDGSEVTPTPALVGDNVAYGCCFFQSGGTTYLACSAGNKFRIFEVTPEAAVQDWALY